MKRPLAVLLLLASLATLIYSNTFSASFHFDDGLNIEENNRIKQLTSIRDLGSSRYVGFLSFALNYHVHGLNVTGYHLVNLLIHITNGFLVYTLVSLLVQTPGMRDGQSLLPSPQSSWVALTTALLFVAHPIQTQAVTYIVQRFTSLAALFYLLAVVCYLKWRLSDDPGNGTRYWWYVAALGSTMLAMKTKEISFTLPVMVVLVEALCFRPLTRKALLPLIPFLVTLPLIPLAHSGAVGEAEGGFARETTQIDRLSYLFTQFRVIVTYVRLLMFPIHQNLDYDYPIYHNFLAWPVLLSFVVFVGLLGFVVYLLVYSSRWRLMALGLAWFFVALSVESSIIPIRDVIFEHRLYLPSVGAFWAASVVAISLLGRWGGGMAFGICTVVMILSVATYQRNRVWADEVTLWSNVVVESPLKARGHNNLGLAYADQGRLEEAIAHYQTALSLNPDLEFVHHNMGLAYAKQGRLEAAIEAYLSELGRRPGFADAYYDLGNAYARQGRLEEAVKEYLLGVRLRPAFPDLHINLGNVYARQGRLDDAIKEYVTVLDLDPGLYEAHSNLGLTYLRRGRLDDAVRESRMAVERRPDLPEAHFNLGVAYASQEQMDEAIREYRAAIDLNHEYFEAHYNLGQAYMRKGLSAEARTRFETVIELRPDFAPAHRVLESLDVQSENLR